MIVSKNKSYITNSMYPADDGIDRPDSYIVDESTEAGKVLADKIRKHAPYFDFVLDEEGSLVNIVLLPKPEPHVIDEIVDEEKIAMAEAIIDLNMRIEELENRLLNGGA